MKKILIIAVGVCVLALVGAQGWADKAKEASKPDVVQQQVSPEVSDEVFVDKFVNDPQWIADKKVLSTLKTDATCQKRWDILWFWAKKGNLEARDRLLSFLIGENVVRPGASGDHLTFQRDFSILSVHALGYWDSARGSAQDTGLKWLEHAETPYNRGFFMCVNEHKSRKCTQIAIEKNVVPTFEEFSEEVDAAVERGKNAVCRSYDSGEREEALIMKPKGVKK